ncbi:MAG: porin [Bauldia sp.]
MAFGLIGLAVLCASAPATSAPVEYVKVCDDFGTGFFYIPGTEICVNPDTGVTKTLTEIGEVTGQISLAARIADAEAAFAAAVQGTAIGLATPNPILPDGQGYAVGINWGTYEGTNALGVAGVFAINNNLMVTGGFGIGFGTGTATFGARAGLNISGGVR